MFRFRWVDCQLRILEGCITPNAVRAALRELPRDLDSIYLRILDTIPERQRQYVRRAMNWLAFSAEPLTLGQLAEAIVIEYDVNKYGEDPETLFDPESLMSICPSLISFEEVRDDKYFSLESRRLRLAHSSVKEYLISERIAQGPCAYYHISEDKANLLMGHACLSRILQHSAQGIILEKKIEETSFLYHSARYWFRYIGAIEDTAPTPVSDAASKVLKLGQCWLDIYDPDQPPQRALSGTRVYSSAIYYSSLLNLVTCCKLLLYRGDAVNLNSRGGQYGNALQAAAAAGNESVVQLLLEHGAEANAEGGDYGNALQAGARAGSERVVCLLLERGADVNAQGGFYGNALQAAAQGGNESLVHLLLERRAEVNSHGGQYGNALQAAAQAGNESIFRLLLECGAE
ncbi:unnamed protein product, partial [Tuber aestivum]